jgi:antitoxin component YwqK of YwqJK toxin-antitoxin module
MKFEKFNSQEYNIVKEVFNKYPLLDNNLAYLVESFIYKTIIIDDFYYTKYVLKYDQIDGEHIYRNGDLLIISNYKEGLRHGEWKKYKIISPLTYPNLTIDSPLANNSKNKILIRHMNHVNGILEGDYLEYHDNGILKIKREYRDRHLEGLEVMYDEFGNKIFEQYYKKGIRHGYCRQFRNNVLVKFSNYYFNQLQGEYIKFYNNGQIFEKYYYDIIDGQSQMHGPAYVYTDSGKPVYYYKFEYGVKKLHIKFDEMGKIELLISFRDNILYESFKSYKDGKLNYEYFYDENGKAIKGISYINGEKIIRNLSNKDLIGYN